MMNAYIIYLSNRIRPRKSLTRIYGRLLHGWQKRAPDLGEDFARGAETCLSFGTDFCTGCRNVPEIRFILLPGGRNVPEIRFGLYPSGGNYPQDSGRLLHDG